MFAYTKFLLLQNEWELLWHFHFIHLGFSPLFFAKKEWKGKNKNWRMSFLIFRKPIAGAKRMRFIGCITTCHVFAVQKTFIFPSFILDNVDWSDYLDRNYLNRNYLNKSQFVNKERKKKTSKPTNTLRKSWESERTSRWVSSKHRKPNVTIWLTIQLSNLHKSHVKFHLY